MEPVKRDGKIKEQIEVENEVRRKYKERWGPMTEKHLYGFYNQTEMNKELRKTVNDVQTKCPYEYGDDGDSYFISKDMYNSLVALCRCGRKKSDGHFLKCLQKVKTIDNYQDEKNDKRKFKKSLPKTSAGMVGWPNSNYEIWEKMTYYISPKNTMPGYKVTDHPYSNIFIG